VREGKLWLPPPTLSRLVLFLTNFLAVTFPGERFFHTLFLAWLQIKGVTLNLFDNVFGLNFALEAAQGIFEGFAFLNANLCQGKYTSQSGLDQATF
jgi:hypothetical protein